MDLQHLDFIYLYHQGFVLKFRKLPKNRVSTKIPEVTKKSVKQLCTLLEYVTASLKSQPLKVARKLKLNITAGKPVSTEELDRVTKGNTSTKKEFGNCHTTEKG